MLNSRQRNQLLGAALVAGAACGLVAGMANRSMGHGASPMSFPPGIRNAARAVLVGEAYDNATIAEQNGDMAGVITADEELQKLKADVSGVEQLVAQANQLDGVAETLQGQARVAEQAKAATLYREVLRLAPHFDSSDPQLLNGLGYFLADHGTAPDDFKEAERLTRRAVQLWDDKIKQLDTDDKARPFKALLASPYQANRAITRDSLAWALFKEGQYDAARTEQERALAECQAVEKDGPQDADLHFHLGEIYRALHRPNDARGQYQQALRLNPKHEESQRAVASLANTK